MEAVGARGPDEAVADTPWAGSCWLMVAGPRRLIGVDDHSRICVSARLMVRESSQRVGEGLALARRTHGVPDQILTDNGKVLTGRFNRPPVEVLFDRVCRETTVSGEPSLH